MPSPEKVNLTAMVANRNGDEQVGRRSAKWPANVAMVREPDGGIKSLARDSIWPKPGGSGDRSFTAIPNFRTIDAMSLGETVMRLGFESALGARIAAALIAATAMVATSGISAGATRNVAVVNSTRTAMVSLQVRPSGSGAWQPNVLGSRPLGVQKQVGIGVPSGSTCYYDLSAQYEDGHRKTKSHVNLCGSSKYSLSDF